jgi:hypothetical protein
MQPCHSSISTRRVIFARPNFTMSYFMKSIVIFFREKHWRRRQHKMGNIPVIPRASPCPIPAEFGLRAMANRHLVGWTTMARHGRGVVYILWRVFLLYFAGPFSTITTRMLQPDFARHETTTLLQSGRTKSLKVWLSRPQNVLVRHTSSFKTVMSNDSPTDNQPQHQRPEQQDAVPLIVDAARLQSFDPSDLLEVLIGPKQRIYRFHALILAGHISAYVDTILFNSGVSCNRPRAEETPSLFRHFRSNMGKMISYLEPFVKLDQSVLEEALHFMTSTNFPTTFTYRVVDFQSLWGVILPLVLSSRSLPSRTLRSVLCRHDQS